MQCHECARSGVIAAALGLCRFCFAGLCKDHLVAAVRTATVPAYGCDHRPGTAFTSDHPAGGRRSPARQPRAAMPLTHAVTRPVRA
jgi:hypothetical protein